IVYQWEILPNQHHNNLIYECLPYPHIVNPVQVSSRYIEGYGGLLPSDQHKLHIWIHGTVNGPATTHTIYPLATNRALRRSIVSLGATLIVNTHLQPTAFLLGGRETNSQVPLCSSACISTIMDCHHPG
ncbi:hypothetical protein CR513_01432, partial [Mucuna pruriens]